MSKEITEKTVKKRSLDSIQELNYSPYFENIVSIKNIIEC